MSQKHTQLPDDNFENWKCHFSCLCRQKRKQSFLLVSGKFKTLGLFFDENKDRKIKMDSFLFKGENNSKTFNNC